MYGGVIRDDRSRWNFEFHAVRMSRPAHLVTLIGLSECHTDVTWLNAGSNRRWLSAKSTGIDGREKLLQPVLATLDETQRYFDLCRVYDRIGWLGLIVSISLTNDSWKSSTSNRFAAVCLQRHINNWSSNERSTMLIIREVLESPSFPRRVSSRVIVVLLV